MKGHLYIISDFPDDYTHTLHKDSLAVLHLQDITLWQLFPFLPLLPLFVTTTTTKCTQQPSVSPPAPRCFPAVSSSPVTQQFLCKCYTSHGRGGLS